eukprot:TRINITY_DN8594_c0_g1_i1.p1 TRINITY_DN8594_c0_g1~~TRINITY_DN8594_c0_g1_i1.p1  ORF type:complete len:346 (+),score=104.85 TRINITY_DN8594_c0_g1_i1:72-1109(+)
MAGRRHRRGGRRGVALAAACAAALLSEAATPPPSDGAAGTPQGALPTKWSYEKPEEWQLTHPECGSNLQSPMEIRTAEARNAPPAFFKLWNPRLPLPRQPLRLSNDGRAIILDMRSRGISAVSEMFWDRMMLSELRWHVPAEHVVDGVRHPLERQAEFVVADVAAQCTTAACEAASGRKPTVIISHLYELDHIRPDRLLQELMTTSATGSSSSGNGGDPAATVLQEGALSSSLQSGQHVEVDVAAELAGLVAGDFYAYPGSSTRPPCAEVVNWFVAAERKTVDLAQMQLVMQIVQSMPEAKVKGAPLPRPVFHIDKNGDDPVGNARPLQPANSRPITLRRLYSAQ